MNFLDRLVLFLSPVAGEKRVSARRRAELVAGQRDYEVARPTYRNKGWKRSSKDADAVNRLALKSTREFARYLVENNAWAARGVEVITSNVIGTGIVPSCKDPSAMALWKAWANDWYCDSRELLPFSGLSEQILRTVVISGECLVRRRPRKIEDRLPIPLALEVLEPDYIDTSVNEARGASGGPTVDGIEFDPIGRRTAYWLFSQHPGASNGKAESQRIPAPQILHIYRPLRPQQTRGITWLAQSITPLMDFDRYEDAQLLKQQIAACFAAFVVDVEGSAAPIGGTPKAATPNVEDIQPGGVAYLPEGKDVKFGTPPSITPDSFDVRQLRRISAGYGVTYEDLTGDYSNATFSSARMGRIAHRRLVEKWQWNMLIPMLHQRVWEWAMTAAVEAGALPAVPPVRWTTSPLPMIDLQVEIDAAAKAIRSGLLTQSEAIREQGYDPDEFFAEKTADDKRLSASGIVLDTDPRKMSQAGQAQLSSDTAPAPGGGVK